MTRHEARRDDEPPGKDIGQGYPEEAPAGVGVDKPARKPDGDEEITDAPSTRTNADGDPSQATGNPRAAGG